MAAALDHAGVDVLRRREARLHHPDRRQQVRDQQRVHDEPGAVLALDHALVEQVGGERPRALDGLGARHQAGDQLDQPQHRHGVEEVDADHLLGPPCRRAELHDRDRAGVAGEDRPVGHDVPVELAEDRHLRRLVLDDGFDDQLAIGEVGEVGRERQPRQRSVTCRLAELAGVEPAVERLHQPSPSRLGGGVVDLVHHDVEPRPGAHLCDAGAHQPASHDTHTFDRPRHDRGFCRIPSANVTVRAWPLPLVARAPGRQTVPMPEGRIEPAADILNPIRMQWVGKPHPLGATYDGSGTNFALFSSIAEGVELCLFGDSTREGRHDEVRIDVTEVDGHIWHVYLPEVRPGQHYGWRVHGPWDPAQGLWCNSSKLLIDPYAKAIDGVVDWTPACFGYDAADP